MRLITLHLGIIHLTPNETLSVENRIFGVGVVGILGRVADETFLIGEGDPRRSNTMTLVVGDNFDTTAALDTNVTRQL